MLITANKTIKQLIQQKIWIKFKKEFPKKMSAKIIPQKILKRPLTTHGMWKCCYHTYRTCSCEPKQHSHKCAEKNVRKYLLQKFSKWRTIKIRKKYLKTETKFSLLKQHINHLKCGLAVPTEYKIGMRTPQQHVTL